MLSLRKHPFFALFVVATDTFSILASFFIAYHTRFSGIVIPAHAEAPSLEAYLDAMIVVIPIYLLIFRSYRLYEPERHLRRIHELLNTAKAVVAATIFLMALTFIYRQFSYSRVVLLFSWFLSTLFCCLGRYLLIQVEYFVRRNKDRQRVLMIGINPNTRNLIRWARENPHYGQEVVAILTHFDTNDGKHLEEVPILGSLKNFDQIVESQKIDTVIAADPALSRETITDLMLKCENKLIGFKLAADFYGLMTHYVDVEYISNVPLLGLKAPPLDDPWNRWMKRLFDFVFSGSALLFLVPLFFLIGLFIRWSDKGPIFYSQERIGRDGKHFKLYKFRTMQTNAEEKTGPVWAASNDERVTAIGKFLRRVNLDELPQLWNVARGDMSLVGPRPERPHFVDQFRDQIPRYMARHKIKSGLTGWAQIHGLRGNTSLEERIKYDLYYMENWTLMLDIEILLATIFAFKNAY